MIAGGSRYLFICLCRILWPSTCKLYGCACASWCLLVCDRKICVNLSSIENVLTTFWYDCIHSLHKCFLCIHIFVYKNIHLTTKEGSKKCGKELKHQSKFYKTTDYTATCECQNLFLFPWLTLQTEKSDWISGRKCVFQIDKIVLKMEKKRGWGRDEEVFPKKEKTPLLWT